MKKYFLILPICMLFLSKGNAQSPLNLLKRADQIARPDIILREEGHLCLSPEENATSLYLPLFQEFVGDGSDTVLFQLLDKMEGNPFIGRGGSDALLWILADAQTPLGALSVRGGGGVSAPGRGFQPTVVADGIARFLVTRTKEELSIAFFRQFKQDLDSSVYLSTLFPYTTEKLRIIDREIYQFDLYLDGMRASFVKDMNTLPMHTQNLLKNKALIRSPHLQILAEDALEVSQNMLDGTAPEALIEWLAKDAAFQQPDRVSALPDAQRNQFVDLGAGFQLLHLLAQTVMTPGGERYEWEAPADVNKQLKNPATQLIYLGLLWQMSHDIRFSDGKSVRDYLTIVGQKAQKTDEFVQLVRNIAGNGHNTLKAIKDYQNSDSLVLFEPYSRFFESFIALTAAGMEFRQLVLDLGNKTDSSQVIFINGMRHVSELRFDIQQKNYSAAVGDLMYVIAYFLPFMDSKWQKKALKYSQFIATVAEAENSQQVEAAIEAVALPPGSSRVKKQNYFSAAINAYTGFSGGGEALENTDTKGFAALSAPVGLTVSWKLGEPKTTRNGRLRTPGSFSLFAPIIDVGGLVAFRFNDPYSSDLPELTWSNLLSPGLYGVWGLGNDLPISVGLGAQRGPNLRKITVNDVQIERSGWRYGAFIAMDIPVFNLFVQTAPRK